MFIRVIPIFLLLFLSANLEAGAETIYFPEVDVLIDVGHGGIDGGTSYGNLFEKDINLEMGKVLYQQLSEKGYHVVLNRLEDYALSDDNKWLNNPSRHRRDLAQRKNLVDLLSPRIVLSLHVDWSSSAKKSGPLVLYQKNTQSFFLADLAQHSLNKLYKTSYLPKPGRTYYMLNRTKSPTVIVEMGYISNNTDRKFLTDSAHQQQLAQAIVASIEEYFTLVDKINLYK